MSTLWYVVSNIGPVMLVLFGAVVGLALRALVAWAWQSLIHIQDYDSVSSAERDIGDAGSGDSRIYVAETPRFQRIRKALTRSR